jgi:Xaa-Pro aminopeptidase
VFARRRQKFVDAMGPDAVALLVGSGSVRRSADTHYPFRQDSDFWYLTGFDHSDAVAVLRSDDGPPFSLFVQPRDKSAEIWNGYRPGVEGALADYGADEARPIEDLLDAVPKLFEKARRIYHVLGRRGDIDARLLAALEEMRLRSRQGREPASEIVDPRAILHEMRLFKEDEEIAIMREAAAISLEAHRGAAKLARPGRFEYELEAALSHAFRSRGASGPAYSSIVGGGANAAILHYVTNDQPLVEGEMVLIDAGAELRGYASDVTRTYPVGGRYTGAGRAVYEVVLAAQESALAACKPGAKLPEIHDAALRPIIDGLVSLGLASGTVDDIVENESYRDYYMHGTSHWLGLDVHDVGRYTLDGEPRPLEPGMAFTVEPGIYIAKDDEKAPEHLRGIGVRIEDDVVVTEGGCENLNHGIPKKPGEVEEWMRD